MPSETAPAEELRVSQLRPLHPVGKNRPFVVSRALVSATIFFALVVGNFCFLVNHERVQFLVEKMSADRWCPRFEHFLCSSARPKLLILSSSVGFVPSIMSDIKNGDVPRPTSVIELQRLSTNCESPAFLLAALGARGLDNVSAVHMGIPTANMSDLLLLLQKSLAYGKKPDVLLLPINIRDFLVPPNWPAIDRLDQPIKTTLGDIPVMPASLRVNRLLRYVFVYARPGYGSRIFDEARFYFAYEIFNFVRPVPFFKSLIGSSDILRNRMAADVEKDNHYDASIVGVPNSVKLNVKEQNEILAFRNSKFEDAQFRAFEQIVALSKAQGINLVIVEVPLYPDMHAPAAVADRYARAFARAAAQRTDVFVFDPSQQRSFTRAEYVDLLHLNGLGGERLFSQSADFLALHKSKLFR